MTPDEMQVESQRYGERAFMVLPLDTGHIAVLSLYREVIAICNNWEEALAASARIPPSTVIPRSMAEPRASKQSKLVATALALDNIVANFKLGVK